MDQILEALKSISFTNLLGYLKSTPAIVAVILNLFISISTAFLDAFRRWLPTRTKKALFSAFLGMAVSLTTLIILYLSNGLPDNLNQSIGFGLLLFFTTTIVAYVALIVKEDKTAMGKHQDPIDKDIPDIDFKDRLYNVTQALTTNLRDIDIQTNWSILNFVPLDAEVELKQEGLHRQRKIADLLKAIKSAKNERLFLVIGEPGSGKSVALRKLCQDLSKEVNKTGKIPIYINLKEWQQKWDRDTPPSVQQLNDFVLSNLKRRDIVTSDFFNKYYSRLYEQGRLYFVFDSFDEIPSVLGENEGSQLIRQLSSVMHDFLKGARKNSQGILASRIFRKPTEEFKTNVTLEIRPFTEAKINQTFYKTLGYSESLVKQLFVKRSDLLTAASNPFTASLLANYAKSNKDTLPKNIVELYENYFDGALRASDEILKEKKIKIDDVKKICIHMAGIMFSEYGLEIPISALKEHIPIRMQSKVQEVVDILTFARVGRRNQQTGLFSFSHRRFCEFFVVQDILNNERQLPLDNIPKDSQWRDALVMYCQVAPLDKAELIANYCWDIIKAKNNPRDLDSVHSMRFLRDAFQLRTQCLNLFKKDFTSYIMNTLNNEKDILTIKLCTECLGLLDSEYAEEGISISTKYKNAWLVETALKACRSLPLISDIIFLNLRENLTSFNYSFYLVYNREFAFSLSLLKGANNIKNVYIRLLVCFWFTFITIILSIIMLTYIKIILSLVVIITLAPIFILTKQTQSIVLKLTIVFFTNMYFIGTIMYTFWFQKNLAASLYIVAVPILMFVVITIPLINISYIIKKLLKLHLIKVALLAVTSAGIIIWGVVSLLGMLPSYIGIICVLFSATIIFTDVIINYYTTLKNYNSIEYHKCNDRVYIYNVVSSLNPHRSVLIDFIEKNLSYISHNFFYSIVRAIHTIALNILYRPIRNHLTNKFIDYLYLNIKQVNGEWPNIDILDVDSDNTSTTRLAKLEAKWRGIDR